MPILSLLDTSAISESVEHALDFAVYQCTAFLKKYGEDYYPMYTVNGKFGQDQQRWTHWCDGFFPGILFLLAERADNPYFLDAAVKRTIPLEERKFDRSVHDLGFLFLSTYARWAEFESPTEKINDVLIQAGKTMGMRFMKNGQYLRSFMAPNSLFIDIMMNVGIIFTAAIESNDMRLMDLALQHCRTTRRTLVRGDGSTAHEAIFDTDTGECLRQTTQQGYRGDSCWSRGLAWSLYGFTRSYEQVNYVPFLETAMLNADYLLDHAPMDGVTPWDFDAPLSGPLSRQQVDTSASAIAASALLRLGMIVPNHTRGRAYGDFGLLILNNLVKKYLGDKTPGFEGILNGGVYHIHKNLGVNEAVLFGDYFFVEALCRSRHLLRTLPERSLDPYPEDSLPQSAQTWRDGPVD